MSHSPGLFQVLLSELSEQGAATLWAEGGMVPARQCREGTERRRGAHSLSVSESVCEHGCDASGNSCPCVGESTSLRIPPIYSSTLEFPGRCAEAGMCQLGRTNCHTLRNFAMQSLNIIVTIRLYKLIIKQVIFKKESNKDSNASLPKYFVIFTIIYVLEALDIH
jgi:hypothetical protein